MFVCSNETDSPKMLRLTVLGSKVNNFLLGNSFALKLFELTKPKKKIACLSTHYKTCGSFDHKQNFLRIALTEQVFFPFYAPTMKWQWTFSVASINDSICASVQRTSSGGIRVQIRFLLVPYQFSHYYIKDYRFAQQ